METIAVSKGELRAFSMLANAGDVDREADQMGRVVVLGRIQGFVVALTTNGHTGAMQVFSGAEWPLDDRWIAVSLKDAKGLLGAKRNPGDSELKVDADAECPSAWYESGGTRYPVKLVEKPSWADALVGYMELPAEPDQARCIGLDPGYLASMAGWNSAAKVYVVGWRLWFDGDLKAVHARPNDRDDVTYIVMPHRIGSSVYVSAVPLVAEEALA